MKIDLIKWRDGELVVGELKKSSKFEMPAKMQLAYYLYRLREQGINLEGELLIPKERKRKRIKLDDNLIQASELSNEYIKIAEARISYWKDVDFDSYNKDNSFKINKTKEIDEW